MITNIITQIAGQQEPASVTQVVKCDLPSCDKSITFDIKNGREQALVDAPWLRTYRTVNTGDGRHIGYCGDICETKGIATGTHNIPEPKRIVAATDPATLAAAQAAAAQAKEVDKAIRTGGNVTIQES
jgi:hypothetical protein